MYIYDNMIYIYIYQIIRIFMRHYPHDIVYGCPYAAAMTELGHPHGNGTSPIYGD